MMLWPELIGFLKEFPPGRRWPCGNPYDCFLPVDSPQNCLGRICTAEHYGASYAQFIRYLKLFGISECVGTADSPYDVLLSIPEVRKFREEQANCKLRKVRKKAVKSDVADPVQSNLQGDGFVHASAWLCLQSLSDETDLRSDPLMGWVGFTAGVKGPVATGHHRKSALDERALPNDCRARDLTH
jgi:hypothetical protein